MTWQPLIQHVPQDPWGWALHRLPNRPGNQTSSQALSMLQPRLYTAQKRITLYAHTYPLTTPALKA